MKVISFPTCQCHIFKGLGGFYGREKPNLLNLNLFLWALNKTLRDRGKKVKAVLMKRMFFKEILSLELLAGNKPLG